LTVDPKKRPRADDVLAHTWMIGDATPRKNLPNITDKIREYNAKKKFKVFIPFYFSFFLKISFGFIFIFL